MSWYLGVDLGSTTSKAVVVDDAGTIQASSVVQMGAVSRAGMQRAVDEALAVAGVAAGDLSGTVSTGYGRRLVPLAQRSFTEITCHARGTAAMVPGTRLVIDIGGQDSKAITVDADGLVEDFAMNDRCASGTGRFYDVLARAIECDIGELGLLALRSSLSRGGGTDLEVSSMCATFAETEIVSLLAQGLAVEDIAASVHRAIAARTLALVAQVGKRAPVVLTGGVARNSAARHFLAVALDHEVIVPEHPQITGAFGAALLAREHREQEAGPAAAEGDADRPSRVAHAVSHTGPGHSCAECDGRPSAVVELGAVIGVRNG